ncbi:MULTISPECIES: DUF4307 domain-containing protein [Catellatospora]|uniref:Membrane protein n=1 Tax=Catellatospora citrea TaxID=53366 RepID=A0A8J3P1L4_9ACTN|nr:MULTISPECIES: DUF4307 domain-containing protein [Catellatospora]RKE08099.1 uncharacterized protein DUF4307 [Catellatospora citrea]GIF98480.1 membrane protein [Catellatospora citrea]
MTETSTDTAAGPVAERAPWPAGRYGRRREQRPASRSTVLVLAVLTVLAMTFIGARLYRAYGDGDYTASVTAFDEVTDTQVAVTFLVRMPADGTAVCLVRARDSTGTEVGLEEVTVRPGPDPERTMVTHRLVTTGRPVTGEVKGCHPA